MTWALVFEHIFIVLVSGIVSILVGLPLGILAYLFPKARPFILHAVDMLQTIPSLALLGIIMVFAGAGKPTVIIGITLYSLLPIVSNTFLGLDGVDAGVKRAALGMGMSRAHRLFRVELPIALPSILTGVRIAVVNSIATAVFAAFVGGGGIGAVLTRGIRIQDMGLILSGTGVLMLIAILLDGFMNVFEKRAAKKHGSIKMLAASAAALLGVLALLLPMGAGRAAGADEIVMHDGDYTEVKLMARMVKQLVEDRTGLTVTVKDQMSAINILKSVLSGETDLMLSYDGTLLTTFLHMDPSDVPEGRTLFDFANEKANAELRVRLLGKLGFDNTYAIAVPVSLAEEYGIECISDLAPIAGKLTFGAEHDFFTQEGSMKFGPFTRFYGLEFKSHKSVDGSLKYAAVENGAFDVVEVFATDGLNKKAGLKVLKDDRRFFPEYNGALLIKSDFLEKFGKTAPQLESVLALLEGRISNEDMVDMTYSVDVLGKAVDDVAADFLKKSGIVE